MPYLGIWVNFSKKFRTKGKTTKISGNATNHDIPHAGSQSPRKPSISPLFKIMLKHEIAPLIIPERINGINHAICFG